MYTKVVNGMPLNKQRDMLRKLLHIHFPNTVKLCIDVQGAGAGLPSMFYESWEYMDERSGKIIEYPPLIQDDDEETLEVLENALPIIRAIHGMNNFVNLYYPYMKGCFEDQSIELLLQSNDVDILYKANKISFDEFEQHVEHDILQSELSNIKQDFTDKEKMTYTRIVKSNKRDRATSLMYGLAVVCEMEQENKTNLYRKNITVSTQKLVSLARRPSISSIYK